jgi:hypothetical protein
MIVKNTLSLKNYVYSPSEGHELRIQRRLRDDLRINEAGVESILHLRSQLVQLQIRLHQLEDALNTQDACQQIHLARYREACVEASWVELKFQE